MFNESMQVPGIQKLLDSLFLNFTKGYGKRGKTVILIILTRQDMNLVCCILTYIFRLNIYKNQYIF